MKRSGKVFRKILLASTILVSGSALQVPQVWAQEAIPNTVEVKKIAGYSIGVTNEDGGVAEIVKYNADNQKFYVINGYGQTIDIVSLKDLTSSTQEQQLQKEKSINIADAVNTDTFTYGDLTSIDINPSKDMIVAAVQDEDYTKNGKIVVLNYDGEIQKTYDTGVQPDMVKMTADGKYILSANEAEPRGGLEGPDPEGSITIVETETGKVTQVKFDDQTVIEDDVHIRNNGTKADAIRDLEPEYMDLSKDGSKAFITLQENNAIATIDIQAGKVKSVKSLGYKDHSLPGNELDAAKNGKIELETLPILGAYMPDSISYVNIGGTDYLVTANEGDATEWPEEEPTFLNIADFKDVKDTITLNSDLFKGMTAVEAQAAFDRMKGSNDYKKLEVLTDRGNDAIYTLGGRSFSIWKADTMELVYDSRSEFETITAERYPDVFNWSNDDDEFEKRSSKKGPEPEDVKVGMIGNQLYAFVGLERMGGVMTYNISNPENAEFANYINNRDFSQAIAGDVAPEGLDFITAELSPTGRPLVLVGNEVSGTVSVLEFQVDPIKQIEGISLDQTQVSLKVGETAKLNASIQPADTTDSKELLWTSSNEKVASVTPNGLVTAISDGNAIIKVQTKNGNYSATAAITVTKHTPPVTDPNSVFKELNRGLMNQAGEILFDFSTYPQLSLEITTDQVNDILSVNSNAKIKINKGDVEVEIPLAIFKNVNQNVILKIHPKSFSGAIGQVYDFTIQTKDGKLIDKFGNQKVMLVFKVNPSMVKNWKDVVVYYIDQNGKKVEKIVPAKVDSKTGLVSAEVGHFSTYGVFEEAVANSYSEIPVNSANHSGSQLPDTATNNYNFILFGFIFVVLGGIVLFLNKRRVE
jgi:LPXTG-motif cell wall-anchored protein